jgi:dipeptide transport system ATP-binding protein
MSLLAATDVTKIYQLRPGLFQRRVGLHALDHVSFTLDTRKTLAVVGESGCGKSTLARILAMLDQPTSGAVTIDGRPATPTDRTMRRSVQMVFQNPYGSLNPRKSVMSILEEPLLIAGISRDERRAAVHAMMARVGLRRDQAARYPHMFSGGQRQRIAIARALMLHPRIIVADEPVSALDVSVRAQVLNLLADLREEFGLAYVFISHDLSVVRYVADDVLVMYLGRVVEQGTRDAIFLTPRHPYTRALLAATPGIRSTRPQELPQGEPPSPIHPPTGCTFHTRCPNATGTCRQVRPLLRQVDDHEVACHHADNLTV